jgi:predicted RNA-binding Zn-ribbon protein involved in translation (DUF1610 family)
MKSWRALTWFILIVQVLFVILIISAVTSTSGDCSGLSGDSADMCKAGTAIGLGIGFGFILFLWALIDIILGVTWMVTNKRSSASAVARQTGSVVAPTKKCPECAEAVLADAKVCRYCGHHFSTANFKCFKCKHVQAVLASQTTFVCDHCGQGLKRPTQTSAEAS